MAWVRDINSLYDFIAYVIVSAPNEFPHEDYLSDEEQMTLDLAFQELRKGIRFIEADFPGADNERGLSALLDQALAAYRSGNDVRGAHLLQDFERLVFKSQ